MNAAMIAARRRWSIGAGVLASQLPPRRARAVEPGRGLLVADPKARKFLRTFLACGQRSRLAEVFRANSLFLRRRPCASMGRNLSP